MVQVRLTGATPTINGASVVTVTPQSIQQAVAEFQNPNPAVSQAVASRIGGTVVGGAKKPAKKKIKGPKPIPPARLRVVTVNGSGVQGVATEAKVELQKAGWPHTVVGGTLPQTNLFSTHVYYTNARAHASAEKLRRSLGDTTASVLLPAAMSDFGLDADVVVAIGSAFSGVTAPPSVAAKQAAPPPERPLVQAASASDPGDFFLLQKRVGYKLLYPSKVPLYSAYREAIESSSNAFRVYPLGKHGKALAVDARTNTELVERLGPALHDLDGRADPRAADAPGLLGQAPGARLHERPGHPPHRRVLRRPAVQGRRRSRRLDRQLARRQAVARDDDRDRAKPGAGAPGAGLIVDTGRAE